MKLAVAPDYNGQFVIVKIDINIDYLFQFPLHIRQHVKYSFLLCMPILITKFRI